jgi:ketosteroid isomerase-like protein
VAVGNPVNEAVFRRSVEAWNADDWEKLESLWNPNGHIVAPEGWPEPGRRDGWNAIRKQFDRIKESWTEEHAEILDIRSAGDLLFASLRWVVRGEASGAPLEVHMWMLCAFQDGMFTSIEYFLDRDAAMAAAEGIER